MDHMMTSPAKAIIESFYPKVEMGAFCPSITPPCSAAPHIEIPRPSPVRELGERLAVSVSSMEMKPEVVVAPAPIMVPAVEKCEITPPAQEIATSVSVSGPTETAVPKRSFAEHVKHFFKRGFSNVGDFVAGEEPVILPSGKDYLMGDDIRQKAASMEAKVAAVAAASIPAVKQVYTTGKRVAEGIEAAAKAIDSSTPGGLTFAAPNGATLTGALEAVPAAAVEGTGAGIITTAAGILSPDDFTSLSFARKTDGGDRTPKVGPTPKEWVRRTPEDVINHFKELKKDPNWQKFRKAPDGKSAYRNEITKEVRYRDDTHNEIESFSKDGQHVVIDPVTGEKILSKCGKHKLPDWLK
jgi:hypothetical protein